MANRRCPTATVHRGSAESGGAQFENGGPTSVLTRRSAGAIAPVTVIEYVMVTVPPAGIGPDHASDGGVNSAVPALATTSLLNVAEPSTSERSSAKNAGDTASKSVRPTLEAVIV